MWKLRPTGAEGFAQASGWGWESGSSGLSPQPGPLHVVHVADPPGHRHALEQVATSGWGLEGQADSLAGELGPGAERYAHMLRVCVHRVLGRPPREMDGEMRFTAMVYLEGDRTTTWGGG